MDDRQKKDMTQQNIKRMVLVTFLAGLLTFVVAGVALLVGFYLDRRAGTTPQWTLIFLLGSAPFSLVGVYFIARQVVRRMRQERDSNVKSDDMDGAH